MRPARLAAILLTLVVPTVVVACEDDAGPAVKLSAEGTKGKAVTQKFNCQSCHSIGGDELTGPTWKGLYGASVTLANGSKVTIDAEYIERAIREPNADRRDDATGQMPTFDEERISDAEVAQIVAYIEDLSK